MFSLKWFTLQAFGFKSVLLCRVYCSKGCIKVKIKFIVFFPNPGQIRLIERFIACPNSSQIKVFDNLYYTIFENGFVRKTAVYVTENYFFLSSVFTHPAILKICHLFLGFPPIPKMQVSQQRPNFQLY